MENPNKDKLPKNSASNNELNNFDEADDINSYHSNRSKIITSVRKQSYIIFILLLFIIALFVLIVSLAYTNLNGSKIKSVCTTPDCIRTAWTFIESMNKSVDPCEDFYQFACGNYPKKNTILHTTNDNTRFDELDTEILLNVINFMEKNETGKEPQSVLKARMFYRSCMNINETHSIKTLIDILDKISFPKITIKANISTSASTKLFARAKKIVNIEYLFYSGVQKYSKNRTVNIISLARPNYQSNILPLNKLNIRNSREKNDDLNQQIFYKLFARVVTSIFALNANYSMSSRRLSELATQIYYFDELIIKLKDNVYDHNIKTKKLMTIDEFQKYFEKNGKASLINWKEYFIELFENVENVTLDFDKDMLQISNMEYFQDLHKILSTEENEILVVSLWWKTIVELIPYTSEDWMNFANKLMNEINGIYSHEPRTMTCAKEVNNAMGHAVAHFLVDLQIPNSLKNMMTDMINNINWAFDKIVAELDWMDEETKQSTLKKKKSIKTLVGFPEFIADSNELDEYYLNYNVTEDDFLGNVVRYQQNIVEAELKTLRIINDFPSDNWKVIDPLTVNAYSSIQGNSITIPAAILQFPFFGHDLQVLNYGFLGTILGHELTHSFDNTGRMYDENGNELIWWTNNSTEEYNKRTKCFIDHYESITTSILKKKVNGILTLNENIADNGGLKEALLGYRKYICDHDIEPKLPGLEEYNPEQLFFLSFANNWCETSTKSSMKQSLSDEHSPNYIRVVGTLANSKEFSKVWHCKKGSNMNPTNEKCYLW
ncbi:endothelin-converting enzyme homolog isoform X2 [Daktulosphaira vitifoliae]|uniref:endothelin-converting enzyme homolog isoform X2 n=1 Tax=Daktulosphaira vitifoliae TaxID=58002 RepID=UPI0021A9E0CB|nr:endothelin-converting enzyme homolog isoform X2 [Daktulosphaira vitifoliae]